MRMTRALVLLACFSVAPAVAHAHALSPVSAAAAQKWLPTKMLDEIIASGANIKIAYTSGGPHYQPGWFGGGTIYVPFANDPPTDWHSSEWSNFYNEAFSAWWGNVFMKDARYAN